MSYDGGRTWSPFEDGLFISDTPPSDSVSGGAYFALAAGRDFWLVGDGNGAKYRRGSTAASWTGLQSDWNMAAGDRANEQRLASFSPGEIRMTALSSLVTDPRNDGHWLATDWFELWETFNAGATWTSRMRGIMPLVSYDIAFDPNSADNFICCLYDVGAFVTRDGGRTFARARAASGSTGGREFPNNVATALYLNGRPGVVILAGTHGKDTGLWRSTDSGLTWSPLPGTGLPALVAGSSAVSCLVQDPRDGSVLLAMSGAARPNAGGVYRSRDEGGTWTWEGGGLGNGESFDYGTNHSQGAWPRLVVSPNGSFVTAAQKSDGHLYSRGTNDTTWTKSSLTPPDWRKYPLAADPFTPGRFLCGGGDRPVQESTDGGRTWHTYTPLQRRKCGGIAFDRHESGSVVFACRDGLYHSANGGQTTQLMADGLQLPSGTSRTIALDRGRLFFLTSGSGVWGTTLAQLRIAPGLQSPGPHFGIVPDLVKGRGRQLVDVRALRADPVNGGDIFVLEYEGGDFTNRVMAVAGLAAGAQVSLSLSSPDGHTVANLVATADGGQTYEALVAPGGAEWFTPNDQSRNALTALATQGAGEFAGFRGTLANADVAQTGGVGYATLAEALRAAGPGGTVTLLTDATAPMSLADGRTIVENGHEFTLFEDRVTTFMLK